MLKLSESQLDGVGKKLFHVKKKYSVWWNVCCQALLLNKKFACNASSIICMRTVTGL